MVESKKKEGKEKIKDVLIDSFQIKGEQLRETNRKIEELERELGAGE
jgi:hypothetical protein